MLSNFVYFWLYCPEQLPLLLPLNLKVSQDNIGLTYCTHIFESHTKIGSSSSESDLHQWDKARLKNKRIFCVGPCTRRVKSDNKRVLSFSHSGDNWQCLSNVDRINEVARRWCAGQLIFLLCRWLTLFCMRIQISYGIHVKTKIKYFNSRSDRLIDGGTLINYTDAVLNFGPLKLLRIKCIFVKFNQQ